MSALGVVIPCYRQERFLARTVTALERALAGRDWRGALVQAAPSQEPLPALSSHWQVIAPPASRTRSGQGGPLTPGAARMLGFAACGGAWVLFVDADVEVDAAWLAPAIEIIERDDDPALAGLWGRLEEWFVDAHGERPGNPDLYGIGDRERPVDYLATLALYRRSALAAAGGYDARLRSEEDFELGLRLGRMGAELHSLGMRAARHWSAPRPSFGELSRRWSAGLCFGQGQVLRLYLGRPGFARLLRRQALYLATLAMWALVVPAAALALARSDARPLLAWALLPLALLVVMAARKRSPALALHSLLAWTLNGCGLIVGLFRLDRRAPREATC